MTEKCSKLDGIEDARMTRDDGSKILETKDNAIHETSDLINAKKPTCLHIIDENLAGPFIIYDLTSVIVYNFHT